MIERWELFPAFSMYNIMYDEGGENVDTYLQAIVKQLQSCKFVDKEGHPLENNQAFVSLMDISPTAIILGSPKVVANKYTERFVHVLNEMLGLARGAKTSDYGETWNKLGLQGLYVKLMIKEGRLHELIWNKKTAQVSGESVRDTLIDMACYSVYSIIALDEGNIDGSVQKKEYYVEMMEQLKKRIENMEE